MAPENPNSWARDISPHSQMPQRCVDRVCASTSRLGHRRVHVHKREPDPETRCDVSPPAPHSGMRPRTARPRVTLLARGRHPPRRHRRSVARRDDPRPTRDFGRLLSRNPSSMGHDTRHTGAQGSGHSTRSLHRRALVNEIHSNTTRLRTRCRLHEPRRLQVTPSRETPRFGQNSETSWVGSENSLA